MQKIWEELEKLRGSESVCRREKEKLHAKKSNILEIFQTIRCILDFLALHTNGGALNITVFIEGNGIDNPNSSLGQGCLDFILH